MAVHSINTSNPRETALTSIVTRVNVKRAAATPPKAAITNTDYLQARVNDVLDSYVTQEQRRSAKGKLTPAELAALGVPVEDAPDAE